MKIVFSLNEIQKRLELMREDLGSAINNLVGKGRFHGSASNPIYNLTKGFVMRRVNDITLSVSRDIDRR